MCRAFFMKPAPLASCSRAEHDTAGTLASLPPDIKTGHKKMTDLAIPRPREFQGGTVRIEETRSNIVFHGDFVESGAYCHERITATIGAEKPRLVHTAQFDARLLGRAALDEYARVTLASIADAFLRRGAGAASD